MAGRLGQPVRKRDGFGPFGNPVEEAKSLQGKVLVRLHGDCSFAGHTGGSGLAGAGKTAMREPIQENLVEELTRLVGRPMPVVHEALSSMFTVLRRDFQPTNLADLSHYPMTAWASLAPQQHAIRALWSAVASAGLTTEEVFTTFAVVDDHVRRGFGAGAWSQLQEWGPRVVGRYDLRAGSCPESTNTRRSNAGSSPA